MIHCDRLPPDNKLVFSDDRALLPVYFNDHIQHWLSEWNPKPHVMLREPLPPYDYSEPPSLAMMTVKEVCFQRQYWQLGNMRRIWHAAVCLERGWQILGPEIDPQRGHVIAPSPVVEVIVRRAEQPPVSIQETAWRAAQVWAGLTDAEREKCPNIGQVAAMADLEGLL